MSNVITRQFYNAVEVGVDEFSTEALVVEVQSRGYQVAPAESFVIDADTMHRWRSLKLSGQVDTVNEYVLRLVNNALDDL